MEMNQVLTKFAKKFVIKKYQERFVHEAMKRPVDLHRRICHSISNVFNDKYEGKHISFKNEEKCLFLNWGKPLQTTWKEAKEIMSSGGGGYLVIKEDGSGFYAETEDYPAKIYSGKSS